MATWKRLHNEGIVIFIPSTSRPLLFVGTRPGHVSTPRVCRAAVLVLAAGLLLPGTVAAGDGDDIQTHMTAEQFRAMGLDKLSPEQLRKLNDWLDHYMENKEQVVKEETRRQVTREVTAVHAKEKEEAERVVSQIQGEFKGWTGNTVFRLKNGQVWKQRTSARVYINMDEPKVEIRRGFMGFWVMYIAGTDYSVGVTRVN